jgi:VanZ family protein
VQARLTLTTESHDIPDGCHARPPNYVGKALLMHAFVKYWVPVVAWMLVIFVMSGDLMSAEHTSRFLVPFLRWIAPDISPAAVASIQLLLRKCAHLAEYAILAALLWRAFDRGRGDFGRAAVSAFIFAAIYAALDEFHQSFISSRTGALQDVMIDCGGAILGLVLCRFGRRFRRRR